MSEVSVGGELRQAAALMRQRAEAAIQGPWQPGTTAPHLTDYVIYGASPVMADRIVQVADVGHAWQGPENAAHIASWHPGVAVAVAGLLGELAEHADHGTQGALVLDALDVARAYLGTADQQEESTVE